MVRAGTRHGRGYWQGAGLSKMQKDKKKKKKKERADNWASSSCNMDLHYITITSLHIIDALMHVMVVMMVM